MNAVCTAAAEVMEADTATETKTKTTKAGRIKTMGVMGCPNFYDSGLSQKQTGKNPRQDKRFKT